MSTSQASIRPSEEAHHHMLGVVFPDFEAVTDITELSETIGALLTIILVVAVLMLVLCAVTWAIATSNGHHNVAGKARIGAWTALGTAVLAGAGVAWVNWLIELGSEL